MNILIDIKHPAQLNLFKGLANKLKEQNWKVIICYLDRGKLPKIIDKEYPGFTKYKIGSSRGTKWSIFWQGNVKRTSDFLKLIKKEKIDICAAASSAPLALACKLSGTPIVQFYDDPERKGINKINEILSNKLFFPPIVEESKKVEVFNCLKEWSYLSPTYFKPNPEVLKSYDIKPYEYVFVREVSNKSFNYYDQEDAIVCSISGDLDNSIPYLLSLEDKTIKDKFPDNWTILQEPIEDIHSLIYYSKLIISSGDSMAREGAMLGVPSVYCGIREMKANKLLAEKGLLKHEPSKRAITPINQLVANGFSKEQQSQTREKLLKEWDDMILFMEKQILKYKN
ncbi:DUF354 domain-containing protein [Echinicola sp. CAU 1574]|uniref:DUF354 domain-containing protein n=1 Tax=Echinicola arenosa TaxID=2774144 RepID=A0ABR9AQ42_9BACT|nr:DUF354 domain-containing protein [Echinicola arenosa]MBD8490472.1 DUF354 domain-containing protein [Echinicola arenosa]